MSSKCDLFMRYLHVWSENVLPDRIFGPIAVDPAVVVQDDVCFQVSIIVMSRVVVGDNSRWDAQTTQD